MWETKWTIYPAFWPLCKRMCCTFCSFCRTAFTPLSPPRLRISLTTWFRILIWARSDWIWKQSNPGSPTASVAWSMWSRAYPLPCWPSSSALSPGSCLPRTMIRWYTLSSCSCRQSIKTCWVRPSSCSPRPLSKCCGPTRWLCLLPSASCFWALPLWTP